METCAHSDVQLHAASVDKVGRSSPRRCLQQQQALGDATAQACFGTDAPLRAHLINTRATLSKSVSFASDTQFTERLPTSALAKVKHEINCWELFLLFLLVILVRFAPAGQDIAHVNDIILVYVGYATISLLWHGHSSDASFCRRRAQDGADQPEVVRRSVR
jgi:hypothetical protein